jgi:hypothetical protein
LEVAGFPLRRQAAGVHRLEWVPYLHDELEGQGFEGRERAYGEVPRNRGKNQTLIASITLEVVMGVSMTIEVLPALRSSRLTWSTS